MSQNEVDMSLFLLQSGHKDVNLKTRLLNVGYHNDYHSGYCEVLLKE